MSTREQKWKKQVDHQLNLAEKAVARGDFVTAANCFDNVAEIWPEVAPQMLKYRELLEGKE